jgi:hypothetical protein
MTVLNVALSELPYRALLPGMLPIASRQIMFQHGQIVKQLV